MTQQFVFPLLTCLLLVTLIGRFWGWAFGSCQMAQGAVVITIAAVVAWVVLSPPSWMSFTLNETFAVLAIAMVVLGFETSIMLANWLYPGLFDKR